MKWKLLWGLQGNNGKSNGNDYIGLVIQGVMGNKMETITKGYIGNDGK